MLRVVAALVCALFALPAFAAEQLTVAPAAEWVETVDVSYPALDGGGSPLRFLLEDHQLRFGPDGATEYVRQVAQIRTAAGLADAGSVNLAWNPDTQAITVHRLRILRGGKAIDVLANQAFTVLQREAGLESAILDGALTATIQPEGLEVGDVLELAYSLRIADPLMAGRLGHVVASPQGLIDRYLVRATWDSRRKIAWRTGRNLPKPTVTQKGGETRLLVDLRDLRPLEGPANAPARFAPSRAIWFSDFPDWAAAAAVVAPLYDRASRLSPDSPLHAEVARIRAHSDDPEVRAAEALRLVQERVRYLALVFANGGIDPADADLTWQRRFGDCKGKTALLVALLRELGIEAEPALVSTTAGDRLDAQLPGIGGFDHVLVRAVVKGRTYWLDGARVGDRTLAAAPIPPYRWALPVRGEGARLVALTQPPLEAPSFALHFEIDASAGLDAPAPARGHMTFAGDSAIAIDARLAALPSGERDKVLRDLWKTADWIEIKKAGVRRNPAEGRTEVSFEGVANPDWVIPEDGPRTLDIGEVAFDMDDEITRGDGPDSDAPYAVADHPSHYTVRYVMKLPHQGAGFTLQGGDLTIQAAGRELTRSASIDKGVLTIETHERTLASEVTASEAADAEARIKALDGGRLTLLAPPSYLPTAADIAAWKALELESVEDFLRRGILLLRADRNADAMEDFDKAVAKDPKSAFAYANRGLAHYFGGRVDEARRDLARAVELDGRNYVALHGVGMVAMDEGRYADAAAAYGRAADLKANNAWALNARAGAWIALREYDKALADADEIEKILPGLPEATLLRYRIFIASGRKDRALAALDKGLAVSPTNAQAHLYRGAMLAQSGRETEADAAFAKALALDATPEAYLTRAQNRVWAPLDARLADIADAEKIDPTYVYLVGVRVAVFSDVGQYNEAARVLTAALRKAPDNIFLLVDRGEALARGGQSEAALKDFAVARARAAGNAAALNALCWAQATAGFALEAALRDCDAALAVEPESAAVIDSRALVLLRLGRLDDAAAAYDKALKLRPGTPGSLYGRGIARLRLGKVADGEVDLATAVQHDPLLARTWKRYGIERPAAPTAP